MRLLRQEVWAGSVKREVVVLNVRPSFLLDERRPGMIRARLCHAGPRLPRRGRVGNSFIVGPWDRQRNFGRPQSMNWR
jgi:hypothetical protein